MLTIIKRGLHMKKVLLLILFLLISFAHYAWAVVSYDFDSDTGTLTISGSGTASNGGIDPTMIRAVVFAENSNITDIYGWSFQNSPIESITIPDTVTSIGRDVFHGCSNLKNIYLPDSIENIGYAAFAGTQIDIDLPKNLTHLDASAFNETNLKSLNIPDGVSGAAGCNSCSQLTEVSIGNGITVLSGNAFKGATNLQKISFSEDSALQEIGAWAFENTQIKSIVIPSSVTHIGRDAFQNASQLQAILFEGTLDDTTWRAFMNTSAKVYCKTDANCEGQGSNVQYYEKDETTGIYHTLSDDKYFISADFLVADQNRDKACKDLGECEAIIAAAAQNKSFMVKGKLYNSLNDWLSGNYVKKRIYTVEEANKVSKPTGNTFKVRYK